MMEPRLQAVGAEYAGVVTRLQNELITSAGGATAWTPASVGRLLQLPGAFALLAVMDDPIGFALCTPAGDAADLASLAVAPNWRRHGVGAKLLDGVLSQATERGYGRLVLEVAADNLAACALYRRAGFTQIACRPKYYSPTPAGTARDALVFEKILASQNPQSSENQGYV